MIAFAIRNSMLYICLLYYCLLYPRFLRKGFLSFCGRGSAIIAEGSNIEAVGGRLMAPFPALIPFGHNRPFGNEPLKRRKHRILA